MVLKMLAAANSLSIELNHAMLKQKILPISPLIQCDAGRAKKKLFSWDSKWLPCDKGLFEIFRRMP